MTNEHPPGQWVRTGRGARFMLTVADSWALRPPDPMHTPTPGVYGSLHQRYPGAYHEMDMINMSELSAMSQRNRLAYFAAEFVTWSLYDSPYHRHQFSKACEAGIVFG